MTSIHKSKRNIESNKFYKLLSQTNIQTIENNLFTKLITQKRKKIKIRIKEKEKLLTSN